MLLKFTVKAAKGKTRGFVVVVEDGMVVRTYFAKDLNAENLF